MCASRAGQQVLEHSESTRLQYGLVERAVALGWPRSRVTVIDDDLGVSAAVADARVGFQKLVTEVTMGRVGLIVGFEMSRLARTGRDWHQLLELCTLSDTLLADPDGVYDPSYYNDRLLLGLKGTMSETLCRYRHKASYADSAIMPTCLEQCWWRGCPRQFAGRNHRLSRKAMTVSVGRKRPGVMASGVVRARANASTK
jgi:hypothetical protein